MSGIGNGLQQIGQWKATIGLWVSPIIAIIMILCGVWALKSSSGDGVHTKHTSGTLVNPPTCSKDQRCSSNISYSVNSTTYTTTGQFTGPAPSTVTVAYNPGNPSDATTNVPPPQFIGILFIVVGVLIPILSYGVYYATMHSKLFAQVEGGSAVIGVAENILKR